MRTARKIHLGSKGRKTGDYCPSFKWHIIPVLGATGASFALPLVLAIHRRMITSNSDSIPLTSSVWSWLFDPPEDTRTRMLRHLRGLPGIFRLIEKRTPYSRLAVERGVVWSMTTDDMDVLLKAARTGVVPENSP